MSNTKTTTAREILDKTAAFFAEKGIPSPRLDAEVLLADVLGYDRLHLYMNLDRPMDDAEITRARDMVRRRAGREPVAYIIGRKEFAGRSFKVGPGVLVPRPDTEILVEEVAKEMRARFDQGTASLIKQIDPTDQQDQTDQTDQKDDAIEAELAEHDNQSNPSDPSKMASLTDPLRVLEFGIGSGAIAITLAADNHRVHVTATEINEQAATIARENSETHSVTARVKVLLQPDFSAIDGPFHAIVSNPPYIDPSEKPTLAPEVANHEPTEALFAEDAGLKWYKFLAGEATRLLLPGGFIAVEIGYRQRQAVEDIFGTAGLKLVRSTKDFGGNDRVVIAER